MCLQITKLAGRREVRVPITGTFCGHFDNRPIFCLKIRLSCEYPGHWKHWAWSTLNVTVHLWITILVQDKTMTRHPAIYCRYLLHVPYCTEVNNRYTTGSQTHDWSVLRETFTRVRNKDFNLGCHQVTFPLTTLKYIEFVHIIWDSSPKSTIQRNTESPQIGSLFILAWSVHFGSFKRSLWWLMQCHVPLTTGRPLAHTSCLNVTYKSR